MSIKVISQTTTERNQETRQKWEKIRPLLDQGYSYSRAVRKTHKITHQQVAHLSWFKELVKYGETQGYPYHQYKRCKHNGM